MHEYDDNILPIVNIIQASYELPKFCYNKILIDRDNLIVLPYRTTSVAFHFICGNNTYNLSVFLGFLRNVISEPFGGRN
jgi:hypothetical protein